MKPIAPLLDLLIQKLRQEKELIIKSAANSASSQQLLDVVEEKKELLLQLGTFERGDFEGYQEKLDLIKRLSEENMQLAAGGLGFIEELFETLFGDSTPHYNEYGTVSSKKEGLFTKKI